MEAQRVELVNLVKIFGGPGGEQVVAVDRLSLVVEPGNMITLLGPSGCGKTTTLRMVAGFELPDEGQIFIGQQEISQKSPNARDTAMVFQSYALFPHMNVWENIAYGLRFRKLSRHETEERVKRVMKLVGLEGYSSRNPGQLSGGQQQRVALARALVVEPQVLLFDEPLSNLDAKLREQMREEIRRVQKSLGITSLYVTHDQTEAMSLSDKVVVMNEGRIEQVGTPQEVYRYPTTRFVAEFIGKVNFFPIEGWTKGKSGIDVKVLNQQISIDASRVTDFASDPMLMCRPEAIRVQRDKLDEGISGKIGKVTYLGSSVEYSVLLPNGQSALVIEANPLPDQILNVGEEVGIVLDGENAHILPA